MTKEVLTIRDDEGNPAETGDVTVTGSTAEEADIHYTFQLWNVRELGHANTFDLSQLDKAFTNHELIQVKGGKTYIYTALFESRQVEIRKVSDHTTANVGDVIRYEIHVHNTGTADLTDVVVEDIMTYDGTSAFSGSITVAEQTGVVYDADSGSFTIASISAGQFVNIIYTYTVRNEDAGKTLVNTVVVEDENIDTPDEPVVEIPVYPYYTLTNAEGKWDANGSGTLTAPAVGDEPDEGYNPGSWDVTPPATVSGMEDAVYTYTYKLVPATSIEPADTVNYIVEHYKANEDGTYPAEPTDRGVHGGKIGAAVTAAPMNYEGYCLNEQISTMTGTLVKITKQEDIVVLKLYYDIDKIGDEEDPAKPDDIPDKYQKKVTFKVVNGAWNDKTDADQVVYVTLEKDGKWDKDGFGSLTAPAVGNEPDAGYQAGSWDVTPPSTVSGLEDAVYTYTYLPKPPATGSVTLTKVDSEDNDTTLANVIFDLYRADGTKVDTFTTGKDGTITVNDLSEGEHYWVEVRPAEGYTMDYTKHSFTVTGNATVELEIENTRTPVPEVFSGDHYAYVIGYNDGMVHPEDNITRAEVATIFFRMLDDATREKYMTKNNSFSDVFAGDWYNAAIAARFDKNGNTTGASFSDIYGHWAQKEINVAYNNGWVLGYTDGTFVPDQPISRAEAMTMINRVLQRVPESVDDLLEDMVKWPDNMDPAKWYYLAVQEATNTHDYERKRNGYEHWTKIGEVRDWTELEK